MSYDTSVSLVNKLAADPVRVKALMPDSSNLSNHYTTRQGKWAIVIKAFDFSFLSMGMIVVDLRQVGGC